MLTKFCTGILRQELAYNFHCVPCQSRLPRSITRIANLYQFLSIPVQSYSWSVSNIFCVHVTSIIVTDGVLSECK